MNIQLLYGKTPSVLPELTEKAILEADALSLRLLVLIASGRTSETALLSLLEIDQKKLDKALTYWEKAGVLVRVGAPEKIEKPAKENQEKSIKNDKIEKNSADVKKRSRTTEVSLYTDEEFANVLARRADLSYLINEAQNALGKPLFQNDSKILVSIAEDFGFDDEFMLLLLSYCRRIDKKSMRYVEKVSATLYDLGIKESGELNEYLRKQEKEYLFEKTVRSIFGLGSRAFTTKEKAFLGAWSETYQFDKEMLQKAYDITIGATNKPSLPYANSILERWYAEGIKTPADLEAATEKKKDGKGDATSFNVDDFFQAALDRSYNDEPKKE